MNKSEILFLLIGKNPLPNYVAAKLLAKPFDKAKKPNLCLIFSKKTEVYAKYLKDVLGKENYNFVDGIVNPWNYVSIKDVVNSGIRYVKKLNKDKPDLEFTVGLNYTGGTKAMAVHTYRAMKSLEDDGIKVHYSYLDSNEKAMRFDVEDEDQNIPIYLDKPTEPEFETVKISIDDLLALHGFKKYKEPITTISTKYDPNNLPDKFKDFELENYILQEVNSLKKICGLNYVCSNLEILNPNVSKDELYCEMDIVAIRGYQLFVISCTTAKVDEHIIKTKKCPICKNPLSNQLVKGMSRDVKHILIHKLFQVALRAKELGGGEAKMAFLSMADSEKTDNLQIKLKNDHIKVFGEDDLRGLKGKLQRWFEGN